MATYKNPELRDKLAAEYVLGTLRGQARARFQSLMRYDAGLRQAVAEWEARISPLAHAAPEIAPPERVRRAVLRRISGARPGARWGGLGLWRGLALASTAILIAFVAALGVLPRPEPPMAMVAVMDDDKGQPAMVVSWPRMQAAREPYVRIKVLQEHPTMAPGTAWELWLLPPGSGAPVSMGLIGIDADQVMKLKPALVPRMDQAWGVAMSVEPKGGSPTGAPTGPVIFKGRGVKIL